MNYSSDDIHPTFEDYKNSILKIMPKFFSSNMSRMIITEFGKSLVAKVNVSFFQLTFCAGLM